MIIKMLRSLSGSDTVYLKVQIYKNVMNLKFIYISSYRNFRVLKKYTE